MYAWIKIVMALMVTLLYRLVAAVVCKIVIRNELKETATIRYVFTCTTANRNTVFPPSCFQEMLRKSWDGTASRETGECFIILALLLI
jgi:hypothetical protein